MAAHSYIENEGGVSPYIYIAAQVEPYVRQSGLVVGTASADIIVFSSKRRWFAYANANADVDDACSDDDASA